MKALLLAVILLPGCASAYRAIGISTEADLRRVSGDIQAAADVAGPYGSLIGLGVTSLLTVGWRAARHVKNKRRTK